MRAACVGRVLSLPEASMAFRITRLSGCRVRRVPDRSPKPASALTPNWLHVLRGLGIRTMHIPSTLKLSVCICRYGLVGGTLDPVLDELVTVVSSKPRTRMLLAQGWDSHKTEAIM